MNIFQSIFLGIVQGASEFLPVSSSGHLVLFQNILGLTETAGTSTMLAFTILLHAGTLIAVCFVFRGVLLGILKKPISKLTGYLVIATLPAILAAFFSDSIESLFGGGFLGFEFLFTALLLFSCEWVSARGNATEKKKFKDMKWYDALTMGFMQLIAVLPGVSRSGGTIAGGLFCNVNRTTATRFAFLMSIPVILGSLVFDIKDILSIETAQISWITIIVGMIFAAIAGFLAIRYMLKLVQKHKLYGFAAYTALLGVVLLVLRFGFNITL
ncbi:MAG: undecaprenyl-diphosphate phosphatase [Christensenellales bacterium]